MRPKAGREPFHLWRQNVQAWDLFMAVQTQWRIGMGGREGLDYHGVEVVMQRSGIAEPARDRLFADLRVMERAALKAWAEAKKK